MPTLDELLQGTAGVPGMAPGINPELEQMLGRIAALQSGNPRAPGQGMPPANPTGNPGQPTPGSGPGIAAGAPGMLGTPMAPKQAGETQPMQPQQANLTYQMLIKAGVPEEVARQAMANPKFLQELLVTIQRPAAPQAAPAGGGGGPAMPKMG